MINKNVLLIVAAGKGLRAESKIPKQYVKIQGKSILQITIDNFLRIDEFNKIQIVINKDDKKLFEKENFKNNKKIQVCFGGKERTNSVYLGLKALEKIKPKNVLIHDAVRPFTSKEIILNIIKELDNFDAIMPIIPISDALWFKKGKKIQAKKNRQNFLRAQTPQGFNFKKILSAHKKNSKIYNDDIELANFCGLSVGTIAGSEDNFKVTTKDDFLRAERYLNC